MLRKTEKIKINVKDIESGYYTVNNALILNQRSHKIGSASSAVNAMIRNEEEQRVYMSSILSISTNSPDWSARIANYWDSFMVEVNRGGKDLEIGFIYDESFIKDELTKSAIVKYLKIKKNEDKIYVITDKDLFNYYDRQIKAIHDKYQRALDSLNTTNANNKHSVEKEAFAAKWISIIDLESERYKYSRPLNVNDYMLYRYCLLYRHVANEERVKDASSYIRFYLVSKQEEVASVKAMNTIKHDAIKAYNKLSGDKDLYSKIKAIMYLENQIEELNADTYSEDNSDIWLDNFKIAHPIKLIEYSKDTNLLIKGTILHLKHKGLIKQLPNSTTYVDATDASIILGNNLNDTITWFSNPINSKKVDIYNTKVMNLK